jgi:sarcosine oxidase delta subunit
MACYFCGEQTDSLNLRIADVYPDDPDATLLHGWADSIHLTLDKKGQMWFLEFWHHPSWMHSSPILYCPMCGRKLPVKEDE